MELLATVLILIIWGIYGIVKSLTPKAPPMTMEEFNKHHKQMMNARSKAERKAILKAMNKR